jgi:hypothetical protein
MNKKEALEEIFSQSTGTNYYYEHFPKGIYTDGIKMMAETAGAYWLLDAIFSYGRKEEFQLWTLVVRKQRALLTMREDRGAPKKVVQKIEFTDFPEGKWKFYLVDRILMVPREY